MNGMINIQPLFMVDDLLNESFDIAKEMNKFEKSAKVLDLMKEFINLNMNCLIGYRIEASYSGDTLLVNPKMVSRTSGNFNRMQLISGELNQLVSKMFYPREFRDNIQQIDTIIVATLKS